jgi:hypothetical protein
MAVTFQMSLNTDASVEDYIRNTYGDQEFKILGTKAYDTMTFYTIESFYGMVFNSRVEYGGFDRDMPYVLVTAKAANGKFVEISASMKYENHRETYLYENDAPHAVVQEYADYLAYKRRKGKVEDRLNDRKFLIKTAKEIGAPNYHAVKKLRMAASYNGDFYEVIKLLKSFKKGTIRSQFRMSLAIQIFNWLNDPAPKYNSPLSPKQFGYIRPYRPY